MQNPYIKEDHEHMFLQLYQILQIAMAAYSLHCGTRTIIVERKIDINFLLCSVRR